MEPVRLTIWLAVAAWAAVLYGRCRGREIPGARAVWIAGLAAYLGHVVAAFSSHYHWSHAIAFAETARQTRDLTGFDSGAGLWLNYLLGLLWLIDAVRWLVTGHPLPANRPWRAVFLGIHGFFAFMILNGTVIFGQGPVRWFGGAVFACLTAAYFCGTLGDSSEKTQK